MKLVDRALRKADLKSRAYRDRADLRRRPERGRLAVTITRQDHVIKLARGVKYGTGGVVRMRLDKAKETACLDEWRRLQSWDEAYRPREREGRLE